jgi:hypothetical protein
MSDEVYPDVQGSVIARSMVCPKFVNNTDSNLSISYNGINTLRKLRGLIGMQLPQKYKENVNVSSSGGWENYMSSYNQLR